MSRCGLLVVLAVTATTMNATHLKAQDVYSGESLGFLEPGTRVRVTTENSRESGNLAHVGAERLDVYVSADPVPFSYSEVRLIEVSRGRKRGSRALTIGLGILGLGIGIAVAANEASDCEDGYVWCGYPWIIIPPLFATGGLLLGWGLGQAVVTERWLKLAPAEGAFEGEPGGARRPHLTLSFNVTL